MKFLYIIKYHDKILGDFILELPVCETANTERCFVERVFVIINGSNLYTMFNAKL